tara:strand:- start:631 stop:783 length:153 start_codon:yes stop_codon:yes gene_type:complete
MKEYTIILDDEELGDLVQVLMDAYHGQSRNVLGVIKQLSILKARNEEDYE